MHYYLDMYNLHSHKKRDAHLSSSLIYCYSRMIIQVIIIQILFVLEMYMIDNQYCVKLIIQIIQMSAKAI